ncbi:MAG: ribonuclease J [Dehalococcoidaceae bacterium]|nr:ribonuclease J [Dehalococcoidaceae bacterium]
MKDSMKVIPLGGLGEIGKNMMVFEYNNEAVIVDCGVMFPREEHVGVDVIIPNFEYLRALKNINGILITHGHEDHIGGLPYILKEFDIPVYCSLLTKGLILNKLKERKINKSNDIHLIEAGQEVKLGIFSFEFFQVAHSIPDAGGYIIKTPIGNIVHTGDFKIDVHPIMNQYTDINRLKKLGKEGVKLLLADSTYSEIPGHTQSEKQVADTLHRLIKRAKGRIIIATFASLISRIQIAIDAAEKNNKKIFIVGTSMVNNVNMAKKLGYLKVKPSTLVSKKELNSVNSKNLIIICTGSQGEPTSALTRMASQSHQLISIEKNDTIILSSNPVPGNEMKVSQNIDKLFNLGAKVIYNKMENVHVRGHAAMDELTIIHKALKPEYFVGVHGEMRHLFLHKELAIKNGIKKNNAFVLKDGDILEISKSHAKQYLNKVNTDHIYIDGKGIGDVDDAVLRDRGELSKDGVIVCKIHYNHRNQELSSTEVYSYGVIKDDYIDDWHNQIIDLIETRFNDSTINISEIANEDNIREYIEKFIHKDIRRRPLVLALIV